MAYESFGKVIPTPVTFDGELVPFFEQADVIDITAGYPVSSLAAHLARFFTAITSFRPLSENTVIHICVLSSFFPSLAHIEPFSNYPFKPGFDDQIDRTVKPDPGLCCKLADLFTDSVNAADIADPEALYELKLIFLAKRSESFEPVFSIDRIVIPITKISE